MFARLRNSYFLHNTRRSLHSYQQVLDFCQKAHLSRFFSAASEFASAFEEGMMDGLSQSISLLSDGKEFLEKNQEDFWAYERMVKALFQLERESFLNPIRDERDRFRELLGLPPLRTQQMTKEFEAVMKGLREMTKSVLRDIPRKSQEEQI